MDTEGERFVFFWQFCNQQKTKIAASRQEAVWSSSSLQKDGGILQEQKGKQRQDRFPKKLANKGGINKTEDTTEAWIKSSD